MITRFKDYKTEQKIIEKTISEIEKFPKKIFIRKTKNYIHNIIVNSSLCLFYKGYYKFKGNKINKIPIPEKIYKYENLFKKIDIELLKSDGLFKALLNQLKSYLIYCSYFPYILEIQDNEYKKKFNIDFISFLINLFNTKNSKEIEKIVKDKDGFINLNIFFSTVFDEIRIIRDVVKY